MFCAKIQNGGRRHVKFYFWSHDVLPVAADSKQQNFINLRQSAAELLLFVQKFKMAPAAILDLSLIHI